ncbi:hypothetical protein NDU88_004831 [Pleurodeles waltl]|uniref:Uncharacterized protein n=1 Tax=Pleurodeles waltl TaxID=8319 RepID=A0AAV7WA85_PLEWA|nr:hypothetical protein NDU88_004831 [Pleurodeles waltl]
MTRMTVTPLVTSADLRTGGLRLAIDVRSVASLGAPVLGNEWLHLQRWRRRGDGGLGGSGDFVSLVRH